MIIKKRRSPPLRFKIPIQLLSKICLTSIKPQTIERSYNIKHLSYNQADKPNYSTHIRNHSNPPLNASYHVTVPNLLLTKLTSTISITVSRLCGAELIYIITLFVDFSTPVLIFYK